MKINHVTYMVPDIQQAVVFYNKLFSRQPVAISKKLAYYDLNGLWFALNFCQEKRNMTYQHIAFDCEDIEEKKRCLDEAGIDYDLGRPRHKLEKASVYVRDPFMNLIEFHSGSLEDRLAYYKLREEIEVK